MRHLALLDGDKLAEGLDVEDRRAGEVEIDLANRFEVAVCDLQFAITGKRYLGILDTCHITRPIQFTGNFLGFLLYLVSLELGRIPLAASVLGLTGEVLVAVGQHETRAFLTPLQI